MRYDKLVRDGIPDRIRANGEKPVTHVADDAEYRTRLRDKLSEEVGELLEAENVEEFADVLEVLQAYMGSLGIDADAVMDAKRRKRDERGGFERRIVLEEV